MNIETGIKKALDGDAILFVGAGFSSNAINLQGDKFKRGSEIAKFLSNQAGINETDDLEDAAETYADELGIDKLIELIQNEFSAKELQTYHKQIANIPWKRIYTTNYDNIIENSYREAGKRLTPITLSNDIYKIPKDHTICIHLNGYVESLDREKILTELKLTESSYITASVADSPWAMLFRQDLRLAQAIFFLGYSLFDLDIKRIISESDIIKEKCFFYLGDSPADSTLRRVKKFGTAIKEDVKSFIDKKNDVEKDHIPRNSKNIPYYSIEEYSPKPSTNKITDKSFIDLLLFGKRSNDYIVESLGTGKKFLMERSKVQFTLQKLEEGSRFFVISSDLGNGKSMFLENLRYRASELGYRVYDVIERNENILAELEHLSTNEEKTVLIIEEYQNWIDEIATFCLSANQNASIIVTARNAVNDVMLDELNIATGADEIIEINVDVLDDSELEWIINTLNEYGLWGTKAGMKKFEKFRYLERECKRQIHSILLKLFESPKIADKLNEIELRLKTKGENYQQLLSVFILSILNHGATADILTDIWGANIISNPSFRKDPIVNELISFNYYAALVRSPVAAQYLIQNTIDVGTMTKVMAQTVEKIDAGSKISPRYKDIFKSLTRFSSVQSLFPEKGKRAAIVDYYDSIKNLDSCKRNPLFWLQYAIACLVVGETRQSGIFFETSYSIAHDKGWNTFQIDNHYARYLMVKATQELDYPEVMDSFRKARNIINRQIQDDRRHYPYRVASNYQSFIDRFGTKMKTGEVNELKKASENVLDKIISLPDNRKNHRYVRDCKISLEYVISRCLELSA
jgi:hypothetical protein